MGQVEEALAALEDCTLCPRDCHVNRPENKFAVCKTGRYAVVGSHFAHRGEEAGPTGAVVPGPAPFHSPHLRNLMNPSVAHANFAVTEYCCL